MYWSELLIICFCWIGFQMKVCFPFQDCQRWGIPPFHTLYISLLAFPLAYLPIYSTLPACASFRWATGPEQHPKWSWVLGICIYSCKVPVKTTWVLGRRARWVRELLKWILWAYRCIWIIGSKAHCRMNIGIRKIHYLFVLSYYSLSFWCYFRQTN